MKTYRTTEQFTEIMENAENGNWSDAFKCAEEYGFYANDLLKKYNDAEFEFGYQPYTLEDLVIIAEGAQKLRE